MRLMLSRRKSPPNLKTALWGFVKVLLRCNAPLPHSSLTSSLGREFDHYEDDYSYNSYHSPSYHSPRAHLDSSYEGEEPRGLKVKRSTREGPFARQQVMRVYYDHLSIEDY